MSEAGSGPVGNVRDDLLEELGRRVRRVPKPLLLLWGQDDGVPEAQDAKEGEGAESDAVVVASSRVGELEGMSGPVILPLRRGLRASQARGVPTGLGLRRAGRGSADDGVPVPYGGLTPEAGALWRSELAVTISGGGGASAVAFRLQSLKLVRTKHKSLLMGQACWAVDEATNANRTARPTESNPSRLAKV